MKVRFIQSFFPRRSLWQMTTGTKTGQCACDIRNPQGSCCLGNVGAVVKRVEESLALPVAAD